MMKAPFGLVTAMLCVGLGGLPGHCAAAEKDRGQYTLVPDEHGMVLKTSDGRVVFRYMTKKPEPTNLTANSVCCLYPVNTPSGVRVVDFAPGDHRHHRGIFLAWHSLACGEARADFWGWGELAPTAGRVIRNREVKLISADAAGARLEAHNDWCVGDKAVVQENLSIAAGERERVFVIDLAFRLTPQVDIQLERSAFGGLCVKGRKEGKGVYTSPDGRVGLPQPHYLKPETDWPGAAWYDYTIQLNDGPTAGVAVVDHPQNPPSTWHNLEPIAMLNPCIVAPGPVALKKDQPLVLRYRLIVHDGPAPGKLLNSLADEFRKA